MFRNAQKSTDKLLKEFGKSDEYKISCKSLLCFQLSKNYSDNVIIKINMYNCKLEQYINKFIM